MKRIIFSVFIIVTAFVFSVSAQNLRTKQTFENGIKFANKGEFETALAKFQMSLSMAETEQTDDNFRAKIHFNIGVCFYQLKAQTKAVAEFERAIELDANYEKSFYALGMAQFELKNLDKSERAFLGAIRVNNQNGETWFDLAFVYLAQENFDAAKTAFQKSIKFKTRSASIGHNNLGVIFAIKGDFNLAIKEFETALKKSDGKFAVAERNLQFCKSYKQNSDKNLIAKLEFSK